MTIGGFIVRRIALAVPTIMMASIILFMLLMVGPDPLAQLSQETDIDTAQVASQYGWDRPWTAQYIDWASGLVRGDWGKSIRTNESAAEMIRSRLPLTATLALGSTTLALLGSIILGMWSAKRKNTRPDRLTVGAMIAISALPSFLIALIMQWFAVQLKDATGTTLFYVGGMPRDGGLIELIQRLSLPILCLTVMQIAAWMRFQRMELIGVLGDETMLSAEGRGLPSNYLMRHHALPRTVAPLITLVGLELGTLIGGTLIIETVFGLPGLGRLLLDSVQGRDVVVALDIVVLAAVALIVTNTIVDILVAKRDPRALPRT